MRRNDFDNDDGRTVEANGPLPCSSCRGMTPRATLAQYGAMCIACYEHYCTEPQPVRPRRDTPTQADMRKRLRNRILDSARAGHPVSTEAVTKALMASGEITPPTPSEYAMAGWVEDRGDVG